MGWFLRSKSNPDKSKRRAVTVPKGTSWRPQWNPQRAWQIVQVSGTVAVVVGILAGWAWCRVELVKYVGAQRSVEPSLASVELINAPAWLSPLLRHQLAHVVATEFNADPLDHASLARARGALESLAWVEDVQCLQRLEGGVVRVWARYREPVAVVRGRDGYHLVDARGIRLPGLYLRSQVAHLGMPVVEGVSGAPHGEGEVWPGDDLQAALALVLLIRDQPWARQVQVVDASTRDALGRVRLTLRTARGGLVRWGLAPGRERPIEPDSSTKLAWLRAVDHQRGSIDAGGKVVEVFGATVFVRPLPDQALAGPARYTSGR